MHRFYPDANASARGEIPDYHGMSWSNRPNHIVQDAVGDPLGEDSLVPVGPKVLLERLALDAAAVRSVTDGDFSEVGLTGHRAMGGEFLGEKSDLIVAGGRADEGLLDRFIRRGKLRHRASAQQRERVGGICFRGECGANGAAGGGAKFPSHTNDGFPVAITSQARSHVAARSFNAYPLSLACGIV